nr:unnamed protein product [Digitaria exilis]
MIILRSALRAAGRLRWVPRVQPVVERSESYLAPHLCATASPCWDVQESPPTSSCGLTQIGHGCQLRPFSAAAAAAVRGRKQKPLVGKDDDEEEVDKELRAIERRRVYWTAQQTFMEYLHVTRGLVFADAEHISTHSPAFVSKLLNEVKDAIKDPVEGGEEVVFKSKVKRTEARDQRATKALVRLFRYHPINEFEPFFESMGLKPGECKPRHKGTTRQIQGPPNSSTQNASGGAKSNKKSGGQKKSSEAAGSTQPSSKKQKTSGAFQEQSIDQLNDVTAVSGVNIRM